MNKRTLLGHAGFTLAEMLVSMGMLAVATAIVVPGIISHLSKGEAARVAFDLAGVEEGIKAYFKDTQSWPASLTDLVTNPDPGASTIVGKRWAGPYLDYSESAVAQGLETGLELRIANSVFLYSTPGGDSYLSVRIENTRLEHADLVDEIIDGAVGPSTGSVRTDGDDGSGRTTLVFLATPYVR